MLETLHNQRAQWARQLGHRDCRAVLPAGAASRSGAARRRACRCPSRARNTQTATVTQPVPDERHTVTPVYAGSAATTAPAAAAPAAAAPCTEVES